MGCAPSYPIAKGPIVYELSYFYDTSGEYKHGFIASNGNVDNHKNTHEILEGLE